MRFRRYIGPLTENCPQKRGNSKLAIRYQQWINTQQPICTK